MLAVQVVPWRRLFERQFSKGVVGSNPHMDKNVSFCNSIFVCAADSLTSRLWLKSFTLAFKINAIQTAIQTSVDTLPT